MLSLFKFLEEKSISDVSEVKKNQRIPTRNMFFHNLNND